MELEFLLAPLGIALVVALSWWLGALKSAALEGPSAAIERFRIDFPTWQPVDVVVSADKETALLLFPDGVVGLVFAIGTKFSTRLWKRGDILKVDAQPNTMSIHTRDLALPKVFVDFGDQKVPDSLAATLRNLVDDPLARRTA